MADRSPGEGAGTGGAGRVEREGFAGTHETLRKPDGEADRWAPMSIPPAHLSRVLAMGESPIVGRRGGLPRADRVTYANGRVK